MAVATAPVDGLAAVLDDLDPSQAISVSTDPAHPHPTVLSILARVCETIGIPWTPTYGAHLQRDVLTACNFTGPTVSYEQMSSVLAHFARVPSAVARKPAKVAVIGGGAFGTAMACALGRRGHNIVILMREEEKEHVDAINTTRKNTMSFPDDELPETVRATLDPSDALLGVALIVHAIPVQFSFSFLTSIKEHIPNDVPIVSTSKGISVKTLQFMNEVLEAALGPSQPTAFMSGPSFAKGMVIAQPTIISLAAKNDDVARSVQLMVSSPTFRVYTTRDVAGLEVTGSLKNVLAIAVGVVDGLGMGPNTQCGLVTRGWKDIYALAKAHGGDDNTMISLAGMGDLILTCYGGMSRNNKFGRCLAQGETKEQAIKSVGQVVEGLPTAGACVRLAEKLGVRVPVLDAINEMLEGRLTARDMIQYVMTMQLEEEFA